MKKREAAMAVALFVLVAFLASGCATGGRYVGPPQYPGPLGQVVDSNLGLLCPGDVFIGQPVNQCFRHIGAGNIGSYMAYPMYRNGQLLSEGDKIALYCGLGGAGVAALLDGSWKKVFAVGVVSAVGCKVAGEIISRKRGARPPDHSQPQGNVRVGSDGIPVALPDNRPSGGTYQPVGGAPSTSSSWVLKNMTGGQAELFDGQTFVKVMQPRERYHGGNPAEKYRLVILIPGDDGSVRPQDATIVGCAWGWALVAPSKQPVDRNVACGY